MTISQFYYLVLNKKSIILLHTKDHKESIHFKGVKVLKII